jgi:Flp pilus assembly protein TadG
MRVNRRGSFGSAIERFRREESGAALMVVAVCLIVLMGMLVLVVDLGRAVAIKRQMVNGSDSAALAAAQQCALGNSASDAEGAADAVLANNRSDASVQTFSAPGCGAPPEGPELVTVESTVTVDYFFAGIVGFESGPVVSRAVAIWGVTQEGHAVPITVDLEQLNDCGIAPDDPPNADVDCEIDYPKDALTEPRWGTLDLENWGDPEAAPCSTSAGTLKNQIENGGLDDPLPAPAFTCMDNGLSDSVWEAMVGMTLLFPVMDLSQSTGTVKPTSGPLGGSDCTGADIEDLRDAGYDCQIDTAYIVGWIELFVADVNKHGSDLSVEYEYKGFTTTPGLPCEEEPCPLGFGAHGVRLVE